MKIMLFDRRFLQVAGAIVFLGAQAAAWADIIPADRVAPWRGNVGVDGGIPNVTTIYRTLTPANTLADINNAIASCPSNQVVKLAAGTYNLAGSIVFNDRNGVVLRGSGRASTVLVFTRGGIDIEGSAQSAMYNVLANNATPPYVANWTGGYTLGTNQITLSTVSGLAVGTWICLDQLNDRDGVEANGGEGFCAYCGRGGLRSQLQWCQVRAINGNQVTINPPLFMPNWGGSSKSPQAWWGSGNWVSKVGIESLTIDGTASGGLGPYSGNVYIFAGMNCWVKDVISKASVQGRTHILHYGGARCELRHSDLIGVGVAGASLSYAVNPVWSTADWHEDNVINGVTGSIVPGWAAGAVVNSYNLVVNNLRADSPAWNQLAINAHNAHANAWLNEGNYANGYLGDFIHGSAGYITLFRNRFHGRNPGTTLLTYPVVLQSKNRFLNSVGNVLGTAGYHNRYVDIGDSLTQRAIYLLGWMNGQSAYDPAVVGSLYAHGNYDVVNNGVVWASTNADRVIPASLLYNSKPAWFGDRPWPPFEPANGAAIAANSGAYTNIPAGYRFLFGIDPPSSGSGNQPPVAVAGATPVLGAAPLAVNFSSAASYDPEGTALSFSWVFGDGATSTAANPSHTFQATGVYSVQLSVSDGTNVTAAAPVKVTVTSTRNGLVAAYGFEEGSGTGVVDASGNGNSGTITAASWVTGKFGTALAFNGSSSMLQINDSASLELSTGMTLEAWVFPTAANATWSDIIWKDTDIYFLMGTTPQGASPCLGGSFTYTNVYGTGALPLNTWSHLAGTYDGSFMRLYVNGVQVGSRAQTGSIRNSANAVWIGGNGNNGEYWTGSIDEVRIYNRALSPNEIQTDMNTPVALRKPSTPTGLRVISN